MNFNKLKIGNKYKKHAHKIDWVGAFIDAKTVPLATDHGINGATITAELKSDKENFSFSDFKKTESQSSEVKIIVKVWLQTIIDNKSEVKSVAKYEFVFFERFSILVFTKSSIFVFLIIPPKKEATKTIIKTLNIEKNPPPPIIFWKLGFLVLNPKIIKLNDSKIVNFWTKSEIKNAEKIDKSNVKAIFILKIKQIIITKAGIKHKIFKLKIDSKIFCTLFWFCVDSKNIPAKK